MTKFPGPSIPQRLLSGGFRLFFPGSALLAAVSIAIWVPWFLGLLAAEIAHEIADRGVRRGELLAVALAAVAPRDGRVIAALGDDISIL